MWMCALTRGTVLQVAGVKFEGSGVVWRPVLRPSSELGCVAGRPEWPWMRCPLLTLRVLECSSSQG